MPQQLIMVLGLFLTSNVVAFSIYKIKNRNKEDKIEIMSVRSELKKIRKLDEIDKKSMF
jgi:hypothetical protein